ncbi:unnamed protein product [Lota lota]
MTRLRGKRAWGYLSSQSSLPRELATGQSQERRAGTQRNRPAVFGGVPGPHRFTRNTGSSARREMTKPNVPVPRLQLSHPASPPRRLLLQLHFMFDPDLQQTEATA